MEMPGYQPIPRGEHYLETKIQLCCLMSAPLFHIPVTHRDAPWRTIRTIGMSCTCTEINLWCVASVPCEFCTYLVLCGWHVYSMEREVIGSMDYFSFLLHAFWTISALWHRFWTLKYWFLHDLEIYDIATWIPKLLALIQWMKPKIHMYQKSTWNES